MLSSSGRSLLNSLCSSKRGIREESWASRGKVHTAQTAIIEPFKARYAGAVRYRCTWQAAGLSRRGSADESGKTRMRLCCLTKTLKSRGSGARDCQSLFWGIDGFRVRHTGYDDAHQQAASPRRHTTKPPALWLTRPWNSCRPSGECRRSARCGQQSASGLSARTDNRQPKFQGLAGDQTDESQRLRLTFQKPVTNQTATGIMSGIGFLFRRVVL